MLLFELHDMLVEYLLSYPMISEYFELFLI